MEVHCLKILLLTDQAQLCLASKILPGIEHVQGGMAVNKMEF